MLVFTAGVLLLVDHSLQTSGSVEVLVFASGVLLVLHSLQVEGSVLVFAAGVEDVHSDHVLVGSVLVLVFAFGVDDVHSDHELASLAVVVSFDGAEVVFDSDGSVVEDQPSQSSAWTDPKSATAAAIVKAFILKDFPATFTSRN